MISRAQIARHPIHPMLVTLPIGMWVFALATQIIFFSTANPMWQVASTYAMAGGVIGAVLAAIAGFVEIFAMPPSRVRRIAITHMTINLTVAVLFAVAFALNYTGSTTPALVLAIIGIAGLIVSGWLGGTMVYIYHMGMVERTREQAEEPFPREKVEV